MTHLKLSLDRKKCPKKFRLQFWSINDGLLTSTAVQKWKTRSLLSKWPVVNIIWPQVITHAASCRSTDCSGANKSIYLSLQYPRHWTSNCMPVWPIIRSYKLKLLKKICILIMQKTRLKNLLKSYINSPSSCWNYDSNFSVYKTKTYSLFIFICN